jgi:hypothetical protein
MSQSLVPFQPPAFHPANDIIVSGEHNLQPASSAREWLRLGRHIYDNRGAPLKIIDWYSNAPVVLEYVMDAAELIAIPPYNHHFNIGDWKNVYQRQIRQVDYWANQFDDVTTYAWRGNHHQRETHGRIAIEYANPQTMTAAEKACLKYIQQGEHLV